MGDAALLGIEINDEMRAAMLGMILRDRIHFQEFMFPECDPRKAEQTPLHDYLPWIKEDFTHITYSQHPMFLMNVCVVSGGRGTGKTERGQNFANIQTAFIYSNAQVVSISRGESHLNAKLMNPTESVLTTHKILKHWVRRWRKKDKTVELWSGGTIQWASVGRQGKGGERAEGFQGFRATTLVGDEVQQLEKAHMQEAQQQLLVDPTSAEDQRNRGAGQRLFGVPDGSRDTPMYEYDTKAESRFRGTKKIGDKLVPFNNRWKLPSPAMPYFTASKHKDLLSEYSCDPSRNYYSQRYKKDVWGLHGRPAERWFPADMRLGCSKESSDFRHVQVDNAEFQEYCTRSEDGKLLSSDMGFLGGRLPSPAHGDYGLGIDVGTAALTPISGWVCEDGVWRLQFVVELLGWRDTLEQAIIIDYLCSRYDVKFIGMDMASEGAAIYDMLRSSPMFELPYRDFLYGYHEGGKYVFSRVFDKELDVEVEDEAKIFKQWTMEHIRNMMRDRTYELPAEEQCHDVHAQLDDMMGTWVHSTNSKGRYEFTPAHPHYVSSFQFFSAAESMWHMRNAGKTVTYDGDAGKMIFAPVGGVLYGGGF